MTENELIAIEKAIQDLWEDGKIKAPVHFSGGNEKELIKIFKEVNKSDYVVSTHRNHYHYLLHGGDSEGLIREIVRLPGGLCKGRAGSMVTQDISRNFYSTAIVGGGCAIACGIGYALKARDSKSRVWCFVGDGCMDTGHFWEAFRYVVGHDLPVVFVIEDNDRSTCTNVSQRWGEVSSVWPIELKRVKKYLRYYKYKATYPHVGSGKYVQF